MRPQGHGVEPAHVITIDAPHHAPRDEREDETIRQHNGAGSQRRQNTVLHLIEEIRCVHQRQRQPRRGVLGKKFIDVASHQIRTAQPARLHRKPLRFQPLLQ